MDLVGIIIPRSAKIVTDFGTDAIPSFIEESGFRQVILNLAINARDAIERNGRIRISLKKVKRGQEIMKGAPGGPHLAKTNGAEISLSDNGQGIAHEHADKIFEPFFTTKDSMDGSGFGLYNSKLFIEDHNGRIGFSSEIGKGTTFYLFLPYAGSEEDALEPSRKAKRATREFVKVRKSSA